MRHLFAILLSFTLLAVAGPVLAQEDTRDSLPPPAAASSEVGDKVAFDLAHAADFFNQLTAFELKSTQQVQIEAPDGSGGVSSQTLILRQSLGPDFYMEFSVDARPKGRPVQQSGYTAVRTGGYLYFQAVGGEKYFRREATPQMVASAYVKLDQLQGYLSFMQAGGRFVSSRKDFLGRPAREYRMVSAVSLTENPLYEGNPVSKSTQRGEVWIDEASGLVLKLILVVDRESKDDDGIVRIYRQIDRFEITRVGSPGEIQAPRNYYEAGTDIPQDPVQVPVLQDPR